MRIAGVAVAGLVMLLTAGCTAGKDEGDDTGSDRGGTEVVADDAPEDGTATDTPGGEDGAAADRFGEDDAATDDAAGDVRTSDVFVGDAGGCDGHSQCLDTQRCVGDRCVGQPEPCGVPSDRDCNTGLDEASCKAAGGTRVCTPAPCVPPEAGEECLCYCPAGDAGCPCWSDWHCDGWCDFAGDGQDPYGADCKGIGQCSRLRPSYGWGCRCEEGTVMCAC